MISRRRLATLVLLPTALLLIEASCSRVPLLAPSGSTITLTSAISVLPINGTAQITAQVIEGAGTPPQAGTHVTFTTSLGTIQPSEAETNSAGQAIAMFTSTSSGTATITAISGGASAGTTGGIKILVGTAAAQKVAVNASPATIPSAGGTSSISAIVFDVNGALLSGVPVTFSTTAGTLSDSIVTTDSGGTAKSLLTTSVAATVTASVGVGTTTAPTTPTTPGTTPTTPAAAGTASGSITVAIAAAPTLVITPPSQSPTAGIPVTFTFAVTLPATNGSAVKQLTVDWGDGSALQNLGAVTGNAIVIHSFAKDGTYVVTGQVTDASGNVVTVSTVVFVQVAPPLGLSLSTSQSVSGTNTLVTATANVTGLGTSVVQNYNWSWGDGTTADDTSGNQNTHTYVTGSGAKTLTVTITTSTGATKSATRNITP